MRCGNHYLTNGARDTARALGGAARPRCSASCGNSTGFDPRGQSRCGNTAAILRDSLASSHRDQWPIDRRVLCVMSSIEVSRQHGIAGWSSWVIGICRCRRSQSHGLATARLPPHEQFPARPRHSPMRSNRPPIIWRGLLRASVTTNKAAAC